MVLSEVVAVYTANSGVATGTWSGAGNRESLPGEPSQKRDFLRWTAGPPSCRQFGHATLSRKSSQNQRISWCSELQVVSYGVSDHLCCRVLA